MVIELKPQSLPTGPTSKPTCSTVAEKTIGATAVLCEVKGACQLPRSFQRKLPSLLPLASLDGSTWLWPMRGSVFLGRNASFLKQKGEFNSGCYTAHKIIGKTGGGKKKQFEAKLLGKVPQTTLQAWIDGLTSQQRLCTQSLPSLQPLAAVSAGATSPPKA